MDKQYCRISDISKDDLIGINVFIRGWVYRFRKQKEKTFIVIRDDRGGIIQSVFPSSSVPDVTIEASLEIGGEIKKDQRAPYGGYEIIGKYVKIYGLSERFPIGEYQSQELLLDYRHLAIRMRRMINIAKIRSNILQHAREWFLKQDWLEVTPPILVKSAVEGGSTLFEINYFDQKAYLSQSAQLYLEALIFSLGPVWSITPSFRAERSRTVRHLAEFTHLEAEIPWVSLDKLMQFQEHLIYYTIKNTIDNKKEELCCLNSTINESNIIPPYKKLDYDSAIDFLKRKDFKLLDESGNKRKIEWGDDLNIDSERELTKEEEKPVFIYNYPINVKPFYVKENLNNLGKSLSADLLAPRGYGEISSGGMREDNIDILKDKIIKENLNPNSYQWYLDLRRFGSVEHGGFGMGVERIIRWITQTDDIKDTISFPRTMTRIEP